MWSQTWIWQHAWHVIIGVGCFALWFLFRVLGNAVGFYWQNKPYTDQMHAEKRGRERIMESFDREHCE